MAGGVWSAQNKVRPGAYINTNSALPETSDLVSGRVLLATELNTGWGATGAVATDGSSDFQLLFGAGLSDPRLLALKEAYKGAKSVVVVNNNGGNKANGTIGGDINATAKYAGDQGNNIVIDYIPEADGTHATVITLFNSKVVDSQRITKFGELESNAVVDFELSDKSKADSGITSIGNSEQAFTLSGGTTTKADMASLLGEAVQSQYYNVATTAGYAADNPIHALLVELIRGVRDNTGYKITAVVPKGVKDYNAEYVSVVANGVELQDGTKLDPTFAAAGFAGYSASAGLEQSLTYKAYAGAVATLPVMTNEAIINALNKGYIVFSQRKNGDVVIEQDINNLANDKTKLKSFKKNKIIRILDSINNGVADLFESQFIGKVGNNDNGRDLFKAAVMNLLKGLSDKDIIKPLSNTDINVGPGFDSDSLTLDLAVTPIDSMEKAYITITVNK